MYLSLIGMPGTGKTYWARKLADIGFQVFFCDMEIEEKLSKNLITSDGVRITVGEWMGLPDSVDYQSRENMYLNYEIEIMQKILGEFEIQGRFSTDNVVIDTTGSVIYSGIL